MFCGYFWQLLLSFLSACDSIAQFHIKQMRINFSLEPWCSIQSIGTQQCCIDYFNLFSHRLWCVQLESRIQDLAMKISLLLNQHAPVTTRTMHINYIYKVVRCDCEKTTDNTLIRSQYGASICKKHLQKVQIACTFCRNASIESANPLCFLWTALSTESIVLSIEILYHSIEWWDF